MRSASVIRLGLVATIGFLSALAATAQELSPRAYWPAPKGTKVVIVGYSYTTGDVLTDPSLPILGVDSRINNGLFGYLQTFSLWGRTANLVVELPYTWGTTVGSLEAGGVRRDFSAIGDVGLTMSINLVGAPTMSRADFQAFRDAPRALLGASLRVQAPIGKYNPARLINVGTNRWAAKAELGHTLLLTSRWLLEFELGMWVFGDNDEFLGVTREQEPVFAAESHLVRRLKPGFWASLDLNYYWGGRSRVGGDQRADLQRNSRFGGTVVVPFKRRSAVKIGYSTGVVTASGGDFDTVLVSYTSVLH